MDVGSRANFKAGRFAPNTLYIMHYHNDKALWSEVEVTGETPKERYGHSLTFTNSFVILFGGNTISTAMNDAWCLDSKSRAPF